LRAQSCSHVHGNGGCESHGGLGSLIEKFQQAGTGDVIGSWAGRGQNQSISADQIRDVLRSDAISGMAAKMGMDSSEVAGRLSSILPGLVDKMTPNGQVPEGGLGSGSDLMGMLSSLLR
jgi:uncharacterized protein YidB (DUF937 family)